MKFLIISTIFLKFANCQSCEYFNIDPSGNAVSVYDQLGFVLNGCDLVKADQENIRDFLAFSDIFIDHHGYYRSRTTQGAIQQFLRVPDFADQVYQDLLNPFLGMISLGSFPLFLESFVKFYHYGEMYYNFLTNENAVMEFGNKNFKDSLFGEYFENIYSGVENVGWTADNYQYLEIAQNEIPTKPAIVEMAIFGNFYLIGKSINEKNWGMMGSQFWFLGNLATSFSVDLVYGFVYEQITLWNQLISIFSSIRFSGTWDLITDVFFTTHDVVSDFHAIVRSIVRFLSKSLYELEFGENLLYLEKPILNSLFKLNGINNAIDDIAQPIQSAGQDIAQSSISILEDVMRNVLQMEQVLLLTTSWTWVLSYPVRIINYFVSWYDIFADVFAKPTVTTTTTTTAATTTIAATTAI